MSSKNLKLKLNKWHAQINVSGHLKRNTNCSRNSPLRCATSRFAIAKRLAGDTLVIQIIINNNRTQTCTLNAERLIQNQMYK